VTAGDFNITQVMMAAVHDEAKDELEKNKGEFSVYEDLQMELALFLVAPWRTVLITCLKLNYSSNCEARSHSLFIDHCYLYMYEGVEGWRRCLFKYDHDH
jgi:hypothetical protein